jgi:hypothetical protein
MTQGVSLEVEFKTQNNPTWKSNYLKRSVIFLWEIWDNIVTYRTEQKEMIQLEVWTKLTILPSWCVQKANPKANLCRPYTDFRSEDEDEIHFDKEKDLLPFYLFRWMRSKVPNT